MDADIFFPQDLVRFLSILMVGKELVEMGVGGGSGVFSVGQDISLPWQGENGS